MAKRCTFHTCYLVLKVSRRKGADNIAYCASTVRLRNMQYDRHLPVNFSKGLNLLFRSAAFDMQAGNGARVWRLIARSSVGIAWSLLIVELVE